MPMYLMWTCSSLMCPRLTCLTSACLMSMRLMLTCLTSNWSWRWMQLLMSAGAR